MFGFIILPITSWAMDYSWTKLAPVTVGGWHWLQTLVLINPLIYVNEGMRAAFTLAPHMRIYVVYPVVFAFGACFSLSACATSAAGCCPEPGPGHARAVPEPRLSRFRAAPGPVPRRARAGSAPRPGRFRAAPGPVPRRARAGPAPRPGRSRAAPGPVPRHARAGPAPVFGRSGPLRGAGWRGRAVALSLPP